MNHLIKNQQYSSGAGRDVAAPHQMNVDCRDVLAVIPPLIQRRARLYCLDGFSLAEAAIIQARSTVAPQTP